jgi:hypothetical protein
MKKTFFCVFGMIMFIVNAGFAVDISEIIPAQDEIKHNRTTVYAFSPMFLGKMNATNPPAPSIGIGGEEAFFLTKEFGTALRIEYYHFFTDVNFGDNEVTAYQAGCFYRYGLSEDMWLYSSLFAGAASIKGSKNPINTADAWTKNDLDKYSIKAWQVDAAVGFEKQIAAAVTAGLNLGYKTLTGPDVPVMSNDTWFIGALNLCGHVSWYW